MAESVAQFLRRMSASPCGELALVAILLRLAKRAESWEQFERICRGLVARPIWYYAGHAGQARSAFTDSVVAVCRYEIWPSVVDRRGR